MISRSAIWLVIFMFLGQSAYAQDIVGFAREDFGKVVLSKDQAAAGDLQFEVNIGAYNNEPISGYGPDAPFVKLGRSIGRLDILTDKGVFPCTGFLISERYVLTNHHCVPGIIKNAKTRATRIEAVQLVLGYWVEGVEDNARRFNVSVQAVETDEDLDYSVLEVFGNPASTFGSIRLAESGLSENYPYWIIGHPMGEAQRISREQCKSSNPAISGGRLRHTCDTLPGNSGSPVIDPNQRVAVALHHAGSSRNSINYAIPIKRIAEHSRIVSDLMGQPATAEEKPQDGTSETARIVWDSIKDTKSEGILRSFINRFPDSVYSDFAKARLAEIEGTAVAKHTEPADEGVIDGPGQFSLFTSGTRAFVRNTTDHQSLLEALRAGREVVVRSETEKGVRVRDTFSLLGLSDSINYMASSCDASGGTATDTEFQKTFRDWSVWKQGKTCFTATKAASSTPGNLPRGEVWFYVSTWYDRNVQNEISILLGQKLKDTSSVAVDVN